VSNAWNLHEEVETAHHLVNFAVIQNNAQVLEHLEIKVWGPKVLERAEFEQFK
jgi:hypothetical protein